MSSLFSKTVKVPITVVLLGLTLVLSSTLSSIGFLPLVPIATAQQFDDEVQGQETETHIMRTPPLPDPSLNDPNLSVETVFRGLEFPTAMAFLGEDDILVTEKDSGRVQRIVNGELQEEPVIDVAVANNNMRGLLGIAISHTNDTDDDNEVRHVFLYFTESGGGEDGDDWRDGIPPQGNRLYRYNMTSEDGDNDQIQLIDETLILDLPATPGPRFNGGPVAIGPDDNVYLIIGTVDHRRTQAQNIIDGPEPDGSSGVIRNTQEGEIEDIEGVISDEVPLNLYHAYGIRSSFGMAFDPVTGNLWDTENGPECCDELNLVEPGFNSGWRAVSGLAERQDDFDIEEDLVDFDGRGSYSDPKFVWQQSVAPTGLAFLNSSELGSEYQDDLFVGDFNNGRLYHFKLNEDRTELLLEGDLADGVLDRGDSLDDILLGTGFGGITDIKVGPDGYLYVLAFHADRGTIFKIVSDEEESEEQLVEEPEDTTSPTVVSTNPDDGSADVEIDITITATFSEDVTGVDEDSFTVNNGTVQGDVTYDSEANTVTFTPADDFEYDTEYTASLSSAIEDQAGNALEDTEWSFTTMVQEEQLVEEPEDTTSPTVVSTNPDDGSADVEIDITITATFSEDVTGVDEDSFTVNNGTVQGDVTYDSEANTVTFTPADDFEYDTEYTASLSSAIEDQAGNALEDTEWSFTTMVQEEQLVEEPEDTASPVLTVPDGMVVEATNDDGTEVTYIVTAEDDVDGAATLEEDGSTVTQDDVGGHITIFCYPSSGSTFPIGNTTVGCSAIDASANEGISSFMVTVEQATYEAIGEVSNLSNINIINIDDVIERLLSNQEVSNLSNINIINIDDVIERLLSNQEVSNLSNINIINIDDVIERLLSNQETSNSTGLRQLTIQSII
jgi:aldose sugar dehydrogenase